MPLYTYECPKCGKMVLKSSIANRNDKKVCPKCNERELKKCLDYVKAIEINGVEATASQGKWRDPNSI